VSSSAGAWHIPLAFSTKTRQIIALAGRPNPVEANDLLIAQLRYAY